MDKFYIKIYIEDHEPIILRPVHAPVGKGLILLKVLESIFNLFGLKVTNWEVLSKTGDIIGAKYGDKNR